MKHIDLHSYLCTHDIQKNINRLADKGSMSVFVVSLWEQK